MSERVTCVRVVLTTRVVYAVQRSMLAAQQVLFMQLAYTHTRAPTHLLTPHTYYTHTYTYHSPSV